MGTCFRAFCLTILISVSVFAEPTEEERAVFPSGKLRGTPLNISSMRSIRLADEQSARLYRQSPGDLIVENVKHNGKWYTARIPQGAVQETYFQSVIVFKIPRTNIPLVAHSQLRFLLSEPAQLYEPGSTKPVAELKDLSFSQDALGTGTGAFNPLKVFKGEYVAATQLMSTEENFFRFGVASRFPVRQWKMDLSPEEGNRVLQAAIETGDRLGYKKIFGFCGTNCTTTAFGALQKGYGDGRRGYTGLVKNLLSGLPYFPEASLRANGIGAEETELMQTELAELKNQPETKQRLRALIRETKAARDAQRAQKNQGGGWCWPFSRIGK